MKSPSIFSDTISTQSWDKFFCSENFPLELIFIFIYVFCCSINEKAFNFFHVIIEPTIHLIFSVFFHLISFWSPTNQTAKYQESGANKNKMQQCKKAAKK